MLRVLPLLAEPGMRLAVPLRNPDSGQVLLRQGYELDEVTISRIRKLEVAEIWIDFPGTSSIREFFCPHLARQQSLVSGLLTELFGGVHGDIAANADYNEYQSAIAGLVDLMRGNPCATWFLEEVAGGQVAAGRHAAQVCTTSVLLGLHLESYLIDQRKRLASRRAKSVTGLGLGAALHDIGMMLVDPTVREAAADADWSDDPRWRAHPRLGYDMLAGNISSCAAAVVLHHHQYFDGSGFPEEESDGGVGMVGEDIHVFSRICAVADAFDHARHGVGGPPEPRVRVLRRMLSGGGDPRFDPVVLAALPFVVPAYPVGTVVRLDSGDLAVVVATNPMEPCRPVVQVLCVRGDDGRDIPTAGELLECSDDGMVLDLRTAPATTIARCENRDVFADNFELQLDVPAHFVRHIAPAA